MPFTGKEKIDRKSIDEFLNASPDVQRSIPDCLSVEREVVPEELLEKHGREIASIEGRYKEDIEAERKKLGQSGGRKEESAGSAQREQEELEEIKEKAEDTLARYEKNREQITKEVKKEVENELEEYPPRKGKRVRRPSRPNRTR